MNWSKSIKNYRMNMVKKLKCKKKGAYSLKSYIKRSCNNYWDYNRE